MVMRGLISLGLSLALAVPLTAQIRVKTSVKPVGQVKVAPVGSLGLSGAASLSNPQLTTLPAGTLPSGNLGLPVAPQLQALPSQTAVGAAAVQQPVLPTGLPSRVNERQPTARETQVDKQAVVPDVGPAASVAEDNTQRQRPARPLGITVPSTIDQLLGDPFAAATGEQAQGAPKADDAKAPQQVRDLSGWGDLKPLTLDEMWALDVEWMNLGTKGAEYGNLEFVLTDDAATAAALDNFFRTRPDAVNMVFEGMWWALRSIVESKRLSAEVRNKATAGLLYRYHMVLARTAKDPLMPQEVRRRAHDMYNHFMSEVQILQELLRARSAEIAIDKLASIVLRARAEADPARGPAAEAVKEAVVEPAPSPQQVQWKVVPANGQRVKTDQVETGWFSLKYYETNIKQTTFFLNRALSRWRLASKKGMRAEFVEARRQDLLSYINGTVEPALSRARAGVPRYKNMTLGRTWLGIDESKRPPHLWVPNNPNLVLEMRGAAAHLQATFETDIDDPATIAEFKRSIEEHWQGEFTSAAGKEIKFTVGIDVKKLGEADSFSPKALKLVEGEYAYALPEAIALPRRWGYDVAAHEFGHIMGLPDEYIEGYRGDLRHGWTQTNAGSLMGTAETGIVHQRHLQSAYRLLTVNSLVPVPTQKPLP
jgi:hypothetical protein